MAGTPDVLASPPAAPRRRWLALGVVAAAVTVAALVLSDGPPEGPGPAAEPSATSAPPTGSPAASATIDPADRITGSVPPMTGIPIGTAAIEAANAVADLYCEQIATWRLTIDGEDGEYLRAVVLMRPSGPAYRNVALRIELTWNNDHYDWVGSRSALESCP